MTHHHLSHKRASQHSQTRKFRVIELTRKGKRWLKWLLIIVAVLLALAVVLSYILIAKEKEPENLEVPVKGYHGIF